MNPTKFIKFDSPDAGPTIILFPATLTHAEVARAFRHPILSAGFVRQTETGLSTYGESTSLGVKADPLDDELELSLQYPGLFLR